MTELLCPDCFGDGGLKSRIIEIRPEYDNEKCDFHPSKKGIPAEAIAEIVDPIFRQHYVWGDHHIWSGEQEGELLEYCVADFTLAEEEAAEVLTTALENTEHYRDPDAFYVSDQNYTLRDDNTGYYFHSELWREFCESITYSIRFFNNDVEKKLREIFDGIQYQKDQDLNLPVRRLSFQNVQNSFWRARVVNSSKQRDEVRKMPALNLGAPPMRLRRAGRMNSSGIQAFYGAFNIPTAISEIRPIVGDKVMVAKFQLTRDIYVLDTTRFTEPIKDASVFNKSYEQRVAQWAFMQEFMDEIAKPISPDDTHLDYIPTQAVAEYLVHKHKFKRKGNNVSIEGIIFKSAQNPGEKNIVLFGGASKAELTDEEKQEDTKRNVGLISEKWVNPWFDKSPKESSPTLKIDAQSLATKKVESAKYPAQNFLDFGENLDF